MTYKERGKRLLEMLDEEDWLHNEVHIRVDRSKKESAILTATQRCLITDASFLAIYQHHAAKIIQEVAEVAKALLKGNDSG